VRLLVKLGGTLLDEPAARAEIAAQIAGEAKGREMIVVHGGGKQMTRFLAERGVESRFENGLRVTTPEVLDAVLKVFAGSVNKELVAALRAAGAGAVGLSGIDGALTEAEPMSEKLGGVGRITGVDARVLDVLVSQGFLPVVACVAGDSQGRIYNANADQMATAIAAAAKVDRLIFLTDVAGVKDATGALLAAIRPTDARKLIDSGVATGGMQAKLTYACEALAGGIGEIIIAPGGEPGILGRLLAGEAVGTRLQPEPRA
jgi:acetylglutamate kinase